MNIEQTIVHIHIEIDDSKEKEKHNQTIKTTIKKTNEGKKSNITVQDHRLLKHGPKAYVDKQFYI